MSRPPHLRLVEARPPDPAGPPRRDAAPDEDAARRAEIGALEEVIEALARRAETCAKLARLAVALAAGGAGLLVLVALGVLGQAPGLLVLGLSALLGGLALGGTNAATRDEVAEALRAREAERDELVGWLDLRLVPAARLDPGDDPPPDPPAPPRAEA